MSQPDSTRPYAEQEAANPLLPCGCGADGRWLYGRQDMALSHEIVRAGCLNCGVGTNQWWIGEDGHTKAARCWNRSRGEKQ